MVATSVLLARAASATTPTAHPVPSAVSAPANVAVAAGPAPAGPIAAGVVSDAEWILTAQLPDGAIAAFPDRQSVVPYRANMAASGLARATAVTGDRRYAQRAWLWLAWYQAHEGPRGFVTDYRLVNGVMVSTGDMDSTDGYAGTFLSAASATWAALPDAAQLRALHTGVTGAVAAIEATQDRDGLTWAKPDWPVKYLMDQAEAYAGLNAAGVLANAMGDRGLAVRAAADAVRMHSAVNGLWDPADGAYDWAVFSDGSRQHTDWSVLYPDAMEQAWAVSFDLAGPKAAASILTNLTATHPEWDQPLAPADINGATVHAGFWAVAGYGFACAGRVDVARAASASIQHGADTTKRAWPFTTGDAGTLIVLSAMGAERCGPPVTGTGNTNVVITGGSLAITAPAPGDFVPVALNGTAETTTTGLAGFSVTDATATGDGWHVTAQATQFAATAGTARRLAPGSLAMSQPTVAANATTSPDPTVTSGPYVIDNTGPISVASAALDTGMGRYDFGATTLTLGVPATVYAGTYSSTVTMSVISSP